jgi:membrane protease subunit HflK
MRRCTLIPEHQMAWNEPGGGGRNNDPWGGRGGGDQGPPDLDEAFRKLQKQLGNIFSGRGPRGGGTGGGGGGGPKLSSAALGIAGGVVLVLWYLSGLYVVAQAERAVHFRLGQLQDEIMLPGLHWFPRFIDTVEIVNVEQVRSHKHQSTMLTQDENLVDVSLTVQWRIFDPKKFLTQVRCPSDLDDCGAQNSLAESTESALRHVIGNSTMSSIITEGREAIAIDMQKRLQEYLDRYGTGLQVSKVNIDQSAPPKQVKHAFDDVQKAKEDEQRVVNEATAYEQSVIPQARGKAQRAVEEATAYRDQVIAQAQGDASRFMNLLGEYKVAKGVTRDRLYLDTMEAVLSSTTKVLVDTKGDNVMYLPLDRILEQQRAGAAVEAQNQPQTDAQRDAGAPARISPPREARR